MFFRPLTEARNGWMNVASEIRLHIAPKILESWPRELRNNDGRLMNSIRVLDWVEQIHKRYLLQRISEGFLLRQLATHWSHSAMELHLHQHPQLAQ